MSVWPLIKGRFFLAERITSQNNYRFQETSLQRMLLQIESKQEIQSFEPKTFS